MARTSRLDDLLYYGAGVDKLFVPKAKEQIKLLFLEVIDQNTEVWNYNDKPVVYVETIKKVVEAL